MNKQSKLDIEKLSTSKKVPFAGDILGKINSFFSSFTFVFACLVSIAISIYFISKLNVEGEFTGVLIYILSPLLMILGIYGIFRTWNNRTLIKITTGLNNVENKALLIEFLHLRKYYIYSESKNYIVVVEEESMSVEDLWTKHFIFIINNNEILFNVQKHYPKLNPPVFFTHIFLRRDLKSFIDRKLKSR